MEKNNHKKGGCYCRPCRRNQGTIGKTSKKICPECGLRTKGQGHVQGHHHKSRLT